MGSGRKGLVSPQAAKVAPVSMPRQLEDEFGSVANNAMQAGTIKPPKPQFRGLSQELVAAKFGEVIQPKLAIGNPDDRYEQEADRVASDVVQKIYSPHPINQSETIQRQDEDEEKIQPKPNGAIAGGTATSKLEASIQSARGSGSPLSDTVRKPMEQAFGADFSGVKVHTDSQSDQLNKSIQAKAFTTGQDIFFREGAYDLASLDGQKLIAHELTHVVQQNEKTVNRLASSDNLEIQRKKGYKLLEEEQLEDEHVENEVKIEAGPLSYENGVVTIPIWGDQELKLGKSGVGIERALPSKDFELELPSLNASVDIPFAPGVYATAGLKITPTASFSIGGGSYSIKAGAEKTLSIKNVGVEGKMGLEITATAGVGVGIANIAGLESGIFGTLGGSAALSGHLGGTANFSNQSYALTLDLNASADIVGQVGALVSAKLGFFKASKQFSLGEKTFANFSYTRNIKLGGDQKYWNPCLTDFTQKEYGDRKTNKILKTVDGKTYEQLR